MKKCIKCEHEIPETVSGTDLCESCFCEEVNENEYVDGLKRAKEIIEKEMEFAKKVNMQMALGMFQVLMLIKKEIEKEEQK